MYNVGDDVKRLFLKDYRQVCELTSADGQIKLTETDVREGGLTVDRYTSNGSRIDIGSVAAAQLDLTLDNRDGRFDGVNFEGVELFLRVGVKKWDAHAWEKAVVHWLPIGYFTVDEPPRKQRSISLSALDRMVKFDVPFDASGLTFPVTPAALAAYCCEKCGVPAGDMSELLNSDYEIDTVGDDDSLTYRRVVRQIAELGGCCAFIDREGKLAFGWYRAAETVLDGSARYQGADLWEKDVVISGVDVETDDGTVSHGEGCGSRMTVSGNGLLTHDADSVAVALAGRLEGFSYRPFSAKTPAMPWLDPLDGIIYIDGNGAKHYSIITNWKYRLNGSTSLDGKGETEQKSTYQSLGGMTDSQTKQVRRDIGKASDRLEGKIGETAKTQEDLSTMIANSLGVYMTKVKGTDGAVIYYFHDAETPEESSIVYTFRANGFAWTDDYQGDDTDWQYGLTRDGNLLIKMLTVIKITADQIDAAELKVKAANVTGKLTANQISVDDLTVDIANVTGELNVEGAMYTIPKLCTEFNEHMGLDATYKHNNDAAITRLEDVVGTSTGLGPGEESHEARITSLEERIANLEENFKG